MHHPNHLKHLVLLLMIGAAASIHVFAQSEPVQADRSYEIQLHALIGSNEAGEGTPLPAGLRIIANQLKPEFNFTSYRLANSFLGRISNSGSLEYKSVSGLLGTEAAGEHQTFLEWSISGLRELPVSNGPANFIAHGFRFGARIPVHVAGAREQPGGSGPVVSYESIGLNLNRLGVKEGTPTLIGTLSLPKTTGTIFLVLTVRPADR